MFRVEWSRVLHVFLLGVAFQTIPALETSAFGITWEEQAERLQKVSATLLDGVPLADPVIRPRSLELKATLSLLPKLNTTVGGKTEKVPASPVHTVPTLQYTQTLFGTNVVSSLQLWGGYLMPGAEKVIGLDAKLTQYLYGGAYALNFKGSGTEFFTNVGMQMGAAELTGAITAATAKDEFTVRNQQFFVAPGLRFLAQNIWFGGYIGTKNTVSELYIPSDATRLKFEDTLSDASPGFVLQGSAGWAHSSGIALALSEVWVPKRLLMPRVTFSYQYGF